MLEGILEGRDKLCVGSGQKPYPSDEWINLDAQEKWSPDIVGNWNDLSMFRDESLSIIVAEQTCEHVGCGECVGFFSEARRTLKVGGSLVFTVPDMKALAQRWLLGQIDDYIFAVNMYGAWMGDEHDRHKWNTSYEGWKAELMKAGEWSKIERLGNEPIGLLSRDWWILGVRAVK